MSLRRSRGYRILLIVLSVACLGGAGYLGYQTFFAGQSAAKNLKAAETAFDRGAAAYQQQKWDEAATRFEEAKILADKAEEALDAQLKEGKMTLEDGKPVQGKILWIKARAIRDRAYAKAHAEGHALFEPTDPQLKESFRSYFSIPEPEAQREAISALRGAADLMGNDPEVVKESLRVELLLTPINWQVTDRLLRKAIELNPNDARAQYFLARFEFDQPLNEAAPIPTPAFRMLRGWNEVYAKKSAERVNKAREHLKVASQNGAHYWRTTGLEAEILNWMATTGQTRKVKAETTAEAERQLDSLLFTPDTGAVAVAAKGKNLDGMATNDALELNWVLAIATDRAVADVLRPAGSPDRIKAVARAAVDLSDKVVDDPNLKVFVPDVLAQCTEVLSTAQRYYTKSDPTGTGWPDLLARAEAVTKKAPDALKAQPQILLNLARISRVDTTAAAVAQNPDLSGVQKQLERALKQAEEGLKIAEETKAAPEVIDQFHAFLAEWKLLTGVRSELIEPHLVRLRASASQHWKLLADYFDGVAAERAGKLEKARKLLEPLTAQKSDEQIARLASYQMAKLSLALGDPARALRALQEAEPQFQQFEKLTPEEKGWADELARSLDELLALEVQATLGVAMQEANRFLRENPGKPFPPGLLDRYENSADALIKRLDIKAGGKSKGNLMARLSLVNYLLRTNRRDVAEARLTELANDYPDSIDVLQMQVLSLVLPRDPKAKELDANGVAAADVLIQKFIREYPRVSQGKAFYASWLMRTNRVEKALEYLKNPENFPGGRGDAINRLLADALMRSGQRAEAQKVLDTLPHSPTVDAQLIMISGDAATADKRLTDAMTRYEEQGRFRLAQARLRLAEGKYEEGIRGLVSAAEFADVGPAAKSLLPLALIAYVDADPAKGREAAVRLSAEMPEELGTYLATALACVFLEEIGTPNDRWEQTKTMYSALNRWEAVAQKQGMKRADTTVTRAMYRVMAGDVDGARQDLAANLSQNPTHVPTMVLLTELALSLPADPVRARELYDMIAKEDPKNPRLMALDAQIKATSGDWLGAAAVYERVIAAEPRNSGAYSARVAALESAKKPDDALQTARDWAARIPDDPRAVVEVVRLLTTSGNKAEAVKTADEYVARRAAEVRKALTEAKPPPAPADIEKTVDQARGFALMAVTSAFFRANAYDEAEARCKEVRKMFPNAEKVILMLGDIATGKQDWDAALALYRELLKQNPRHFIAGNNAAWILAEKKNDPNGALAIVEEVRRSRGDRPIGPERLPPEFLDTIGSVYMKLNRPERFAEMRLIFDAAVKRYPIDPRMYLFLANAQAALGDKPKALENYRLAIHFAGQKNTVSEDQNKAVKEKAEAAVKQLGG